MNFHLTAAEAAYILEDSETPPSCSSAPRPPSAASRRPGQAGIATVIVGWRRRPDGRRTVGELGGWLAAGGGADDPPDRRARPVRTCCTPRARPGCPKGDRAAADDVRRRAPTMAEHIEALANRTASPGSAPTSWSARCTTRVRCRACGCCAVGSPSVVLDKFDAEARAARDRHLPDRTTRDGAHPLRAAAGAARRREGQYDVSRCKLVVAHTGAACPVDVKRRMIEWFGPVFSDAYGATEVGTICTITSAGVAGAPGLGRPVHPAVHGP